MKKRLLAVGDSFTYGEGLDDLQQAWPYQLAALLDYDVCNLGLRGASNTSILRRTLGELAVNNYDLVIIGWSVPARIEWKDKLDAPYDLWPGHPDGASVFEHKPWRLDLLNYINRYHNSAYFYEMYLTQVISLQSYFQAHNIEYRMMDIIHRNHYRLVGAEQHRSLEAKINTEKFVGWGEFGMDELTSVYPVPPGHHPSRQGHKTIAEKIYQELK